MKIDACDVCWDESGGTTIVQAQQVSLRVDNEAGVIDLCPEHQAVLEKVLATFTNVSRIANYATDDRTCPECGFQSASKNAAQKHRNRHKRARNAENQLRELAPTG